MAQQFISLRIRPVTLKNRVVLAPMRQYASNQGRCPVMTMNGR